MTNADDDLQQIYRQATSHDLRRPAARVRQAVLAHAQMALDGQARADNRPALQKKPAVAANWPNWKAALVASLLLAPVAGILVSRHQQALPEGEQLALTAPPKPVTAMATAPPLPRAVAQGATHADAAANDVMPEPGPAPARTAPAKANPAGNDKVQASSKALANLDRQPHEEQADRTMKQARPATALESADSRPDAAAPRVATPAADAPRMASRAADPILLQANRAAEATAPQLAPDELNALLFQAVRAGQLPQAKSLLARGASVNARDTDGQTALIMAVRAGHEGLVRQLLLLGARPDLADNAGLTAVQYARQIGDSRIMPLLMPAN